VVAAAPFIQGPFLSNFKNSFAERDIGTSLMLMTPSFLEGSFSFVMISNSSPFFMEAKDQI
jgi:hypothetical protein